MTASQRAWGIARGLLALLFGAILIADPEDGFFFVAVGLSLSLIAYGVRELVYYFTMARYMVGGKLALYTGVIALDIGMFAGTLTDMPKIYIVLYLLGVHAFSGTIDVMRGMEARRMGASSWRTSMASGAVNIAISIVCVAFLHSAQMIVYIYAAGLAYSAIVRIVTACRKTAIEYIQ